MTDILQPASLERPTAGNTAIVLLDYVTGFAPMIRSQTVAENAAGGPALVQTANTFGVPLVVSAGPRNDPRGAQRDAGPGEDETRARRERGLTAGSSPP
jgi:hypothetical protein